MASMYLLALADSYGSIRPLVEVTPGLASPWLNTSQKFLFIR